MRWVYERPPLDERFPRAENIPCDVPRQKDSVIQPCVVGWQIHEPLTASIEEQRGETFTGQWVHTAHFFWWIIRSRFNCTLLFFFFSLLHQRHHQGQGEAWVRLLLTQSINRKQSSCPTAELSVSDPPSQMNTFGHLPLFLRPLLPPLSKIKGSVPGRH